MFWSPPIGYHYPAIGLEFISSVTIFFILSGYTLVRVYENDSPVNSTLPLSTWPQRKEFFIKRIARLAPVYYLGLAVATWPLIQYIESDKIKISVPISLFWLQSVTIVGNEWNAPLWQVSALACFYLLFPALLQRLRLLSTRRLLQACAACSLLSATLPAFFLLLLSPDLLLILHVWAPFRLPQFILGVCAGLVTQRATIPQPAVVAEAGTLLLLSSAAGDSAAGGEAGALPSPNHTMV